MPNYDLSGSTAYFTDQLNDLLGLESCYDCTLTDENNSATATCTAKRIGKSSITVTGIAFQQLSGLSPIVLGNVKTFGLLMEEGPM